MNILIKYNNDYLNNNLKDLKLGLSNKLFSAKTNEEAIKIINKQNIEKVFIEIKVIEEVNFVGYINKYFPKIKVVIITNSHNENILSAINRGSFAIIREPFTLKKILSNI